MAVKFNPNLFTGVAVAAILALSPAQAAIIGNGDVGISVNGVPQINTSTAPATYTASLLSTFETFGTGAFAAVAGLTGSMNGVLSFSATPGTTLKESLGDFLVFNDGQGGTYNFSVSSVHTTTYNVATSGSAIGLYLLGTTLDAYLGFDPTPTSLNLTFNSTRGSNYSASATLAIPPESLDDQAVPEPMSAVLLGTGLLGLGLVRRRAATKA